MNPADRTMGLCVCCVAAGSRSSPPSLQGKQTLPKSKVRGVHRSSGAGDVEISPQAPKPVVGQEQNQPLAKTALCATQQDGGRSMLLVGPQTQHVKEVPMPRLEQIGPVDGAISSNLRISSPFIGTIVPNMSLQAKIGDLHERRSIFSFSGMEFGQDENSWRNKSSICEDNHSNSAGNRPLSLEHIPLANLVRKGKKCNLSKSLSKSSIPSHRNNYSPEYQARGVITFGALPEPQPVGAPESRSLEWLKLSRSKDQLLYVPGSMSVDFSPDFPIQPHAWERFSHSSHDIHFQGDRNFALYLGRVPGKSIIPQTKVSQCREKLKKIEQLAK